MAKVLILVNHEVVIYNFRKELVEELLQLGHEVYISSPQGERINDLTKMGCTHIETSVERHGKSVITDLKLVAHYVKIVKSIDPDIILSFTIKPNIYGGIAAQITGKPYIANITGLGAAVERKSIMQKITVFLYRIAFRKVSCVFFQNDENLEFFINKKISNPISYKRIPGSGVNLGQFSILEYPGDEVVEFLFVSRIMREKGIDLYLEAAKYIKAKYPNTRFHIVGFCEDQKYVDIFAQLKPMVEYHGFQKDIRPFLRRTHCTVHPSYYPEGISNVLLESAASGRPLITTDRAGCKETVEQGVNGYVVRQKDVKELITAIEKFILLSNAERMAMGIKGRQKVEKEFNRVIVVNAYIEEIERGLS